MCKTMTMSHLVQSFGHVCANDTTLYACTSKNEDDHRLDVDLWSDSNSERSSQIPFVWFW